MAKQKDKDDKKKPVKKTTGVPKMKKPPKPPTKKKAAKKETQKESVLRRCIEVVNQIKDEGVSLRKALKDKKLSSDSFYQWVERDAENLKQLARACERREEILFDECVDIADDDSRDEKAFVGKIHVDRAKLRIQTRLDVLARMNPKKYGAKIEVDQKTDVKISFKK